MPTSPPEPVPGDFARPAPPPATDASALARRLGVSEEAVHLARDSDLLDLHIDIFIPPRLWGYDPLARHEGPLFGRYFFHHLDLPRMRDGGVSGAMWSITTNPFRPPLNRFATFQRNLSRLLTVVEGSDGRLAVARDVDEYRRVRRAGAHAVLVSVQGGNALQAAPGGLDSLPPRLVTRVTLVHLTSSCYGATSSPHSLAQRDRGLSRAGLDLVEALDHHRIFVDLAHIHPDAFWQAVDAHDPTLPLIATHTGVSGVRPHWRNLDDAQLRAIADTGGVVGIIFSENFLKRRGGPSDGRMVVEHMEHVIKVVGEDHVAVGSDFDGAIVPPADLPGGDSYPQLVQHMLDAGWRASRVRKVLGENFLRSWAALRPPADRGPAPAPPSPSPADG